MKFSDTDSLVMSAGNLIKSANPPKNIQRFPASAITNPTNVANPDVVPSNESVESKNLAPIISKPRAINIPPLIMTPT